MVSGIAAAVVEGGCRGEGWGGRRTGRKAVRVQPEHLHKGCPRELALRKNHNHKGCPHALTLRKNHSPPTIYFMFLLCQCKGTDRLLLPTAVTSPFQEFPPLLMPRVAANSTIPSSGQASQNTRQVFRAIKWERERKIKGKIKG